MDKNIHDGLIETANNETDATTIYMMCPECFEIRTFEINDNVNIKTMGLKLISGLKANYTHRVLSGTCEKCGNEKMFEIDECIAPMVKMLNKKGYITTSCCEGQDDRCPYIEFNKGSVEGEDIKSYITTCGIGSVWEYNERFAQLRVNKGVYDKYKDFPYFKDCYLSALEYLVEKLPVKASNLIPKRSKKVIPRVKMSSTYGEFATHEEKMNHYRNKLDEMRKRVEEVGEPMVTARQACEEFDKRAQIDHELRKIMIGVLKYEIAYDNERHMQMKSSLDVLSNYLDKLEGKHTKQVKGVAKSDIESIMTFASDNGGFGIKIITKPLMSELGETVFINMDKVVNRDFCEVCICKTCEFKDDNRVCVGCSDCVTGYLAVIGENACDRYSKRLGTDVCDGE